MMHRIIDQNKRLTNRTLPLPRPILIRMRGSRSPRVPLAVQKRQARVRDIVAAVLVHCVRVGRGGNVERVFADEAGIVQVDGAGNQRKLILWDARAGLKVPPLGAVLVGPGAPGVVTDLCALVGGGVVVGEAGVLGGGGRAAGYGCQVDIADVWEWKGWSAMSRRQTSWLSPWRDVQLSIWFTSAGFGSYPPSPMRRAAVRSRSAVPG